MITDTNRVHELAFPPAEEGEQQAIQAESTLKTTFPDIDRYFTSFHIVVSFYSDDVLSETEIQRVKEIDGIVGTKFNIDAQYAR